MFMTKISLKPRQYVVFNYNVYYIQEVVFEKFISNDMQICVNKVICIILHVGCY
jgi:hypothetical protein